MYVKLIVKYVLCCIVEYWYSVVMMMPSPSGEWSSPRVTRHGQPPSPCHDFTFIPVGQRRAAMFGGEIKSGAVNDDLLIVELTKHTVVSV